MIVKSKHDVLARPCPTCGNRDLDLVRNNPEPMDNGFYAFQCQADRGDGKPCATTWSPATGKRLSLPSDTGRCSLREQVEKRVNGQARLKMLRAVYKELVACGLLREHWAPGIGWLYSVIHLTDADHDSSREN